MAAEYVTFLKELRHHFTEVGSLLPSSRFLARSMVEPIHRAAGPLSILEVGCGTGPVTRQIVRAMGTEDTLLLCEINRRFMENLKRRLRRDEFYHRHRERIGYFCGPVQDLVTDSADARFDIIVSSLPFSNFSPEMVEELFSVFKQLLKPHGGGIVYYEYLGVRRIFSFVSTPKHRARLRGVERVVKKWHRSAHESGVVSTKLSFLICHLRSPFSITTGSNPSSPSRALFSQFYNHEAPDAACWPQPNTPHHKQNESLSFRLCRNSIATTKFLKLYDFMAMIIADPPCHCEHSYALRAIPPKRNKA